MKKVIAIALLGFAGMIASVRAADSMDVSISVSMSTTVSIAWADDTTTAKSWAIANATLNTTYGTDSAAGAPALSFKNGSQVPLDVSIQIASAGSWTHVLEADRDAANEFTVTAAIDSTPTYDKAVPASGTLALVDELAVYTDTAQPLHLQLATPKAVNANASGSIIVRLTGTVD